MNRVLIPALQIDQEGEYKGKVPFTPEGMTYKTGQIITKIKKSTTHYGYWMYYKEETYDD